MKRLPVRQAAIALALVVASLASQVRGGEDRDTREVMAYALTDAGLARYQQATRALAGLRGGMPARCDTGESGTSIAAVVATVNAAPGAQAAIQVAGMTTREYVVFSFSLFQNGLAAWALTQPGGKLPAGVAKANVDFVNRHQAELQQLEALAPKDGCDGPESEDPER